MTKLVEHVIFAALPALISSLSLVIITFVAKKVSAYSHRFAVLEEANKNQLKDKIVACYETSHEKGYISAIQLEAAHRCYESYKELGGNSYIEALIEGLDDIEIVGSIPVNKQKKEWQRKIDEGNDVK